jgi:OOP family OmpA-OmpF porin
MKTIGAMLFCANALTAPVFAQIQGYVTDTQQDVVKDAFELCWRSGYWTPALARAECDPDLLPKPVPPPAQVTQAPAPPPSPEAAKPAAPPPPPPPPKRCDGTITLQSDETFAFNSAALSAAAKTRLDKDVLDRIATCANLESVVIEGHTDRIGSQQANQKLSEARASTVKAYLVSKGIDESKIETLGMGKTLAAKACPDAEYKTRNDLIECLAPNRRVVISVRGPGK